jgi:hypothetical protein
LPVLALSIIAYIYPRGFAQIISCLDGCMSSVLQQGIYMPMSNQVDWVVREIGKSYQQMK